MATVLTYWCLPEEEADFLDFLSKWDIAAYPPETFPNIFDVKIAPLRTVISDRNPSQLDFGPKEFLSEKDIGRRNQVNGIYFYGVSPMQSHTIGYVRPRYRAGDHLGQSNLSVYWKYPNETFTGFIEKNPEFVKWAKKVFSWGRKWASKKVMLNGYLYPATPKVKELVEQNKLTVGV